MSPQQLPARLAERCCLLNWLFGGQFVRAEEIAFGLLMLIVGLYLEDWIDRYRQRGQR